MSTNRTRGVLGRFRGVAGDSGSERLADRDLLDRFLSEKDPSAFETLLNRHGPMVLAACQRTLPDMAAAEDAFQATFLILLRKAGSIRRADVLGNWLYGVACRTAARSRVEAAKRRLREGATSQRTSPDPLADITARELVAALDEELIRLPARYRSALVACYLDGKTRDEAAAVLGWSIATLGRRLARGRDLLRARLARRGLTLSVALFPASLAFVPSALAAPVLTAARCVADGRAVPVELIPAPVERLSRKVAGIMFIGKLKMTATVVLSAGLILLGVGSLARGMITERPSVAFVPTTEDPPKSHEIPKAASEPKKRRDPFPTVLDAVLRVEDKTERVVLLIRVAQARAAGGDAAGAKKDLQQALELADGLDGDTPRGMALREIAKPRLRLGDVEGARGVAEKFKKASDRDHLLFSLAGMQAEAGDIPGARKTAATITDNDQRDGAIEAIGRAEARAGDLTAAVRTADGLKHQPLSRAGVLEVIALAQAKAKDRKAAAASLAESLRLSVAALADAGQRESARAEASVKQAMIGDIEGALKAATALDADNRSDALGRIAVEQMKQGDLPGAVKTLGDIKDVDIRVRAFLDIAHAQNIKKDRVGAEKTLATATDLAAALPAAERAELLDEIRAVRASLLLAGQDVKGALEAAGTIEDGRARWRVLLEVGRAQMEAGDQKAARATFGRAMKATVDYPEGRKNEGGVITLVPAWALVKGSILRQVTAATTTAGGEEEARAYAAGQKSPFVRVMAELGIAEGVSAQDKEEKKPAR